jgi:hypothetical protein
MYKFKERFEYESFVGDIMSIKEFMELHKSTSIMPYDGAIGDVIVDGKITNIKVKDWCMYLYDDYEEMTLDKLLKLKGQVEIRWCNK